MAWRSGSPAGGAEPRESVRQQDCCGWAQYASEQFQRLMADSGIVCSMSWSGNVWDNAAMESFFSSLKTERTERKNLSHQERGHSRCFDFIERFFNSTRRHSTIGDVSPVEFERKVGLA